MCYFNKSKHFNDTFFVDFSTFWIGSLHLKLHTGIMGQLLKKNKELHCNKRKCVIKIKRYVCLSCLIYQTVLFFLPCSLVRESLIWTLDKLSLNYIFLLSDINLYLITFRFPKEIYKSVPILLYPCYSIEYCKYKNSLLRHSWVSKSN